RTSCSMPLTVFLGNLRFFEIARLLVRFNHVASFIKERELQHHCLGAQASGTLRNESTTGQIWRDRGRGKALHARRGDRRRQSSQTEKRTFQAIPRKVRPHAAFGRGRNPLGRQATHCRDRRTWRASGNGRSP